jgi:hypothetical protein
MTDIGVVLESENESNFWTVQMGGEPTLNGGNVSTSASAQTLKGSWGATVVSAEAAFVSDTQIIASDEERHAWTHARRDG